MAYNSISRTLRHLNKGFVLAWAVQ